MPNIEIVGYSPEDTARIKAAIWSHIRMQEFRNLIKDTVITVYHAEVENFEMCKRPYLRISSDDLAGLKKVEVLLREVLATLLRQGGFDSLELEMVLLHRFVTLTTAFVCSREG